MTVQVGLMVSLWQRQGHLHHHKTLVRYAVQHRRGSCLRTITALLQSTGRSVAYSTGKLGQELLKQRALL